MAPASLEPADKGKKKPVSFANLGIGAALNIFEISTLGQPFEVLKTVTSF
jgi:hypothetical protein